MTSYATAVLTRAMATGITRDTLGEYKALFPVLIAITVVLGSMSIYSAYRGICNSLKKRE